MHDMTTKVDMSAVNRAIDKVLAYGSPPKPASGKRCHMRKPRRKQPAKANPPSPASR